MLRQARKAARITEAAQSEAFTVKGRAFRLGVDSGYSLLFTRDGLFRETTGGPLGESMGFDGRKYWATDTSSMPRLLELGDEETAAIPIWIFTGRWLAPNSPFNIKLEKPANSTDEVPLSVRIKHGGLAAVVTLSRSTWLPATLRYTTSTGEEKWRFSDYRSDGGMPLPASISHQTGPLTDTIKIETVSTTPDSPGGAFAIPKEIPADTQFAADRPARVESVHARTGHTLVHPLINGKDVGWFFLDTGAEAMCITPQAAALAGMPPVGNVVVSGVGGATTGSFHKGDRFELGPISISNMTYVEIDLGFLAPAFKQKIAGICGYDLFARAVVTLQPKSANVDLYDPARYNLAAGKWQELLLHERNACVRCKFEGNRSEVFRLDTGAGDTVSFHAPAVRRLNLLKGRETRASQNGGVGGIVAAREGQLAWFEIGGYRFDQPMVTFSLAKTGAFTDEYTAGNVGQAFISPFTVVFDYSRKRIAFVKEK